MNKKANGNPVTRSEIKEEIQVIRTELKDDIHTLDQKVNRVALELVKTQDDVKEIKEFLKTEATTKADHQEVIKYLDEIVHLESSPK
jgi:uncharacterized coiled-coil DUF342 family protein